MLAQTAFQLKQHMWWLLFNHLFW